MSQFKQQSWYSFLIIVLIVCVLQTQWFVCKRAFYIHLEKKGLSETQLKLVIAITALLKLFINENENNHTIDTHPSMSSIVKAPDMQSMISKHQGVQLHKNVVGATFYSRHTSAIHQQKLVT